MQNITNRERFLSPRGAAVCAGLLLLAHSAYATPSITKALIDATGQYISIYGHALKPAVGAPVAKLGGTVMDVTTYTGTLVNAILPPGTGPGSYDLSVTAGASTVNFQVTIGSVGPIGPAGPAGAAGALTLPFAGTVAALDAYAALAVANSAGNGILGVGGSANGNGSVGVAGSGGGGDGLATGGAGLFGTGGIGSNTAGDGAVANGGASSGGSTSTGGNGVRAAGGANSNGYGGNGIYAFGAGGTVAGDGIYAAGGPATCVPGTYDCVAGAGGMFFGGAPNAGGTSYGGDGVDAYPYGSEAVGLNAQSDCVSQQLPGNCNTVAGLFQGDIEVLDRIINSGASSRIDHPQDPAHKYLNHSYVESPDMLNVYKGNITTDGRGNAAVALPDWFEALNQDFSYQLTTIGQLCQATISSEVSHNSFTIRTDRPNVKVSWQVTGVRQDAWANAHRIPVEEDKAKADQGHYLHPELFEHRGEPSIPQLHHPMPKRPETALRP